MKTSRFLVAVLAAVCAAPAIAQDTISATHVFPATLIYARSFLEFVKKANEAGKGVFTIQVRGGPEAIGMMEQPGAARSGVVDMVYSPCAFYAAAVPECDAVSASSMDGPTARKNGGTELLNQIHQKRAGLVLLGWVDSGIRFSLWSTKEPKFTGGAIDIKGFKVRGNPIYNAFLTNYLGAQVINIPATEVYTALERGTIDITAWTQIGVMDLNWDRYIKYRILPEFFQTDLMIIVNQKKWESLSPKSREILQRVAVAHEVSSLQDCRRCGRRRRRRSPSAASRRFRSRPRPRRSSSPARAPRAWRA
jgi:TRAP-type C4-dicarboxylate transport system substrate-binding protein